ncbi:hypothetical protein Fot_06289 [Forsythia ovata]|uniref:Uncharacterized protein n=1 Tax=Forsythia ovata TaxID=205694 RepID=A0ABD1WT83_9LAMI
MEDACNMMQKKFQNRFKNSMVRYDDEKLNRLKYVSKIRWCFYNLTLYILKIGGDSLKGVSWMATGCVDVEEPRGRGKTQSPSMYSIRKKLGHKGFQEMEFNESEGDMILEQLGYKQED